MPLAGVPFAIGREDRALYGERFAGRQELAPGRHNMPPWISPFRDDPTGLEPAQRCRDDRLGSCEAGQGDQQGCKKPFHHLTCVVAPII